MKPKKIFLLVGMVIGFLGFLSSTEPGGFGQEDPGKGVDQKRQELIEKEGRLKREEERLKNIEKEVEAKIQKLNQLLGQIEEGLKKLEDSKSERIGHLVKTFEAMPPEEAAVRLANLGKPLAIQILFKMNTKKAGAVLALMDPKKVAEFTEGISKSEKKIPTK
jgi:flagellar motility protein MotE (MotC chaperone)